MHDDVSTLLDIRSPTVSDNSAIRIELGALAHSTLAAARRKRNRLWRIGIPAISIAIVIGGVSSAAASPAVQGFLATHPHVTMPLPWSTKNTCVNTAYIGADVQVDDPASPATIAAARAYLRQIDFSTIQNSKAWKTASAKASVIAAKQPSTAAGRKATENFHQYIAFSTIVDRMIMAKLKSEGVDTSGLIIMGGTSCHKGGQ